MSRTTMDVLEVFLQEPGRERHGYELIKEASVSAGSLYPILQRLEDDGWVEARWEADLDPSAEKRPRRRYYTITGLGLHGARSEFAAVYARLGQVAKGWA